MKRPPVSIFFMILLFATHFSSASQLITLPVDFARVDNVFTTQQADNIPPNYSTTLVLSVGEKATLVSYNAQAGDVGQFGINGLFDIGVKVAGTEYGLISQFISGLVFKLDNEFSRTIIGPAEIRIRMKGVFVGNAFITEAHAFASFIVTPVGDSANLLPRNAVVIPTDATGDVQIVLEQSADLTSWTEATPGNYGATTTQRFFRVRAIAQ